MASKTLPQPPSRVLKKTGSVYYHCDWHANHYVKVMLEQVFGENDMLSYLANMTARLVELNGVRKPTGSDKFKRGFD